jgi:hypothetical protein
MQIKMPPLADANKDAASGWCKQRCRLWLEIVAKISASCDASKDGASGCKNVAKIFVLCDANKDTTSGWKIWLKFTPHVMWINMAPLLGQIFSKNYA